MQSLARALVTGLMLPACLTDRAVGQAALTKVFEFSGYENSSQNVGLIEGGDGKLYGWISHASQQRQSILWRINRDGSEVTVLHTFTGLQEDGEDPTGLLYGSDGMLYGVAGDQQGLGRIFSLSADGNNYRVIKQFDAVTDRTANPFGLMEASDGRLYGITGTGGPNGMIYGINRDGGGFQPLHRFGATRTDGQFPRGQLLEGPDGSLYGVTASDRTMFLGTVYRVGRDGSGYQILHQFNAGGQGSMPDSGLVLATDGVLRGQAAGGGENNLGGIFKIRTDGSDYQFFPTGTGGAQWYRSVSESGDGHFYGIQPGGGPQFNGTIFRVQLDGAGAETAHSFSSTATPSEGVRPKQLLHATDGFLYFLTHQQSATPIATLTAYTPFLMRFGPVPLPPTEPTQPLVIIPRLVAAGPGSQFGLTFTGEAGREYEVQFANTLPPDWQSAQKITADAQGNVEFIDQSVNPPSLRYFRVVGDSGLGGESPQDTSSGRAGKAVAIRPKGHTP